MIHLCWTGWTNRRSGHAVTLDNVGLAIAPRQCQELKTISGTAVRTVSDTGDSLGYDHYQTDQI